MDYILFARKLNTTWHEHEFTLEKGMSDDEILEKIIDILEEHLVEDVLTTIIFCETENKFVPIIHSYRRKSAIVIEPMDTTLCENEITTLDEILRNHISRKVPFIHNLNFIRDLLHAKNT